MNQEYYIKITGLPVHTTPYDVADLFERDVEECYVESEQHVNSCCVFITGIFKMCEADLIAKDIIKRNLVYEEPVVATVKTQICQQKPIFYNARDDYQLYFQPCPKICRFHESCVYYYCPHWHPSKRRSLCNHGLFCSDWDCHLLHPSGRSPRCKFGKDCMNRHCVRLHPPDWDPSRAVTVGKKVKLKGRLQREQERQNVKLPIWNERDSFCRLLKLYKVLIVTAETGSGKTTQLAQYAAEMFDNDTKQIICTQPRALAAVSIARRVALEFDGESIGYSVGFQVGSNTRKEGSRIMFMTDSAVIYESQKRGRREFFDDVRVLIIDEVHERSLNTDIVLGLAKLCLRERPDDFYVVISSATIKSEEFLEFFECQNKQLLPVTGSPHRIEIKSKPCSSPTDELIPCVKEALETYIDGNVLVFLPGQNEIETAVEEFEKVKSENCTPMQLYGQMPLEKQEEVLQFESKEGQRMIVFCTNVAETSLTIPNVRLVIDSGWAKEAYYDVKRHVNIIKLVRISKSSAQQRAGRAGRISDGVCIQLYNKDELERDHIEPEILRSSMDLVVLQLIRLGFDPLTFSYIDKPSEETILDSIKLLKKLKCIDNDGKNLLSDGYLYSELECDPRLSSFILNSARNHQKGRLAATIASILSAEKSLFYFGLSSRKDMHSRIRKESIQDDSDILFLYSVYEKWKNSEYKCSNSHIGKVCRSCRIDYTNEKCLNNRILETIDRQTDLICETINKSCFGGPYEENENNDKNSRIIGLCLKDAFPEQLGDILVPRLPNRGVRLINISPDPIRADIDRTSVFLRNREEPFQAFVAMSITKLSTGKYLVDRLHSISLDSNMRSEDDRVIEVYRTAKVGRELNKRIKSTFYTENKELKEKNEFEKWIVYEYNTKENSIIIYAPRKYTTDVQDTFSKLYTQCRDEMLSESITISFSGAITAKFKGGLEVLEIVEYNLTRKLTLYDVSIKTKDELRSWLLELTINIDTDIKDFSFEDTNMVNLIFNTDEALEKLRSNISKKYLQPIQIQQPLLEQKLLLTTPDDIHQNDIRKQSLRSSKIDFLEKVEPSYQIQMRNLGNNDSPQKILNGCSIRFKSHKKGEKYVCDFCDEELRDEAFSILTRKLSKTTDLSKSNIDASTRYILTYSNSEIATYDYQHIKLPEGWTLEGYAVVRVSYIDSYVDLERVTLANIVNRTNVGYEIKEISNILTDVRFYQGEPRSTSKAAFLLSNELEPLKLYISSPRLFTLYSEILKNGLLKIWTEGLSMVLEQKINRKNEIVIHGPLVKQGELLERINTYANDFDCRYHLIPLDSDTLNQLIFENIKFKEIKHKWSLIERCSIRQQENKIEIYTSDKQYMEPCIQDIKNFLDSCGTKYRNRISCDFCKSESKTTDTLKICGHHYCNCILNERNEKYLFKCKKCQELIHIEDLKKIFSRRDKNQFYHQCRKVLKNYLIETKHVRIAFCYNEKCKNLMRKFEGYQSCNICGCMMCFNCQINNDPLHENIDCNQYLERSKDLEKLKIEARNFLNDMWITNAQRIEDTNPYLKHGYPSFDRFFLEDRCFSISNGVFAFYATSEDLVDRICREGYESSHCPLSILCDIPGVTFHLRADVAFGFSKHKYKSRLIVTYLLKGDHLEVLPGHGYQLKERIDPTHTFELPILRVSKCD